MASIKRTFELAYAIGGKLSPSFKAANSEAAAAIANLSKKSQEAMKFNKLQKELDASFKDFNDKAGEMGAAWGKVIDSIVGPLKEIAVLGGVAGAAIYGLALKTGQMGDDAVKSAAKIGVTTEEFSKMAFAASQSGLSAEQFSGNMTRMNNIVNKNIISGKTDLLISGKRRLSILDENKRIKDRSRLLLEAADVYGKLTNETEKQMLATFMFGKSGTDMIPMLESGSAGIQKLMGDAERLGIVFDDISGNKAVTFMDSWGELKAAAQGLAISVGKQLHEPLTRINEAVTGWIVANRELVAQKVKEFIQDIVKWVKENKEGIIGLKNSIVEAIHQFGKWIEKNGGLVEVLKKVGKAFIAFKALGVVFAIMNAVAATAIFVGSLLQLILAAKGVLATFGGFKVVVGIIAGAAAPMAAIVAAVISLGVAAYLLIKHWDGVVYFFKNLATTIPIFFSDLVDDIKGLFGKLPGWLQNIISPIKNIIVGPIEAIQSLLAGNFKGFFIGIGKSLFNYLYTIPLMIANAGNEIIKAIFGIDVIGVVKAWISPAIDAFWNILDTGIGAIADFIVGEFNKIKEVFVSVSEFLKGFFLGELMNIKEAFSDGFLNGIGEIFRRLVTLIPRLLNDAVKAITGIDLLGTGKEWIQKFIDGIMSVLKNAAGAVKNAVKGLIPEGVLNVVGSATKAVSGVVNTVSGAAKSVAKSIPMLGDGGIATGPSIVAEDGKPEAVIPLTKPKRAAELIRSIAPEIPEIQTLKTATPMLPLSIAENKQGPVPPVSPVVTRPKSPIVPGMSDTSNTGHPTWWSGHEWSDKYNTLMPKFEIPDSLLKNRELKMPELKKLELDMPEFPKGSDSTQNKIAGTFNFTPNINITANGGDTFAIKKAVEDAIEKAKSQFENWFTQLQYSNARVAPR
jgi:hypothetical protein